ncbi:MAG: Ldh family oxidoreductase [Bacteroidota bacterium]|nr:Ldh family oxidoreductase [Bacteroidota bacterium]
MATNEQIYFKPEKLKAFAVSVSMKYGLSKGDAEIFIDNLIDANLAGVDTHGLTRLSIYLKRIKLGLINPHPVMTFEQKFPIAAVLNADNGLGQIAGEKAVRKAIELAGTYGLGAVAVRSSQHFGALGYYCNIAAQNEVICLAFTNAEPALPPWGSYEAYFGTNPLAMGVPMKGEIPVIIDLSTSIVARGKIISAAKRKIPIPEGWALDPEGNPTTDAEKALAGAVLTMAGPKGYALAMMVDVLSGVLSGSGFGKHVHSMYKDLKNGADVGHFFLCIAIEAFMPKKNFYERMKTMRDEIKNSAKREGVDEIYIPGERKKKIKSERLNTGIPLSSDVLDELKALAKENNVTWDLD